MDRLLIRGAVIIDPVNGINERLDMLCENGHIAALAPMLQAEDAKIFDASGLVCAPGLVDMHVHLRDPGQTCKEDIFSGCRAAAAGGVTSLACMPNTQPVCDTPEVISYINKRAAKAYARVYPVGAVTKSLGGKQITDIAALKNAGAVALSDDGYPVASSDIMAQALRLASQVGIKVLAHCEDTELVKGGIINKGKVSQSLGLPGIDRAAEDKATARDIAIAESTGMPVHICHVSTRRSVALIREARQRGVQVTGETAPHYFTLTDEQLKSLDADFRMNPPLRTQDDVNAVIEGLCDGTLSAIATDHAPHSLEDKKDFFSAPNGVIGLETSLAAGITALVDTGYIALERLIMLMSAQPARILGIPAGTLAVGAPADAVIFDQNETWKVSLDELHGKSRNTPFKGMVFKGRVKATVLGGRLIYNNGRFE